MAAKIVRLLRVLRSAPAFLVYRFSSSKPVINADIVHWRAKGATKHSSSAVAFFALTSLEEFRSLLYYRLPPLRAMKWWIGTGMPALYIRTPNIGGGLYFQHGFATTVNARSIGRNCHINQHVTIGYRGPGNSPTIGDNVSVRAGAVVIGDVTIGDGVIIGAGAVVIKSIPSNCTVVGNPAVIVRRDGVRCRERL